MNTKKHHRLLIGLSFIICHLSFSVALTSCSPEEFEGADPNGMPTAGSADFQMTVDQETNQMVAVYTPTPGTYPVWIIDGTSYSTLQEVGYTNTEAGTHTIELRIGNRNGISQAGVSKTFTFNETKVDWSADFRRITGKEWRIANREVGHMGCGPAGTDATEWWSAAVNDKKDFGAYDDRISFTADTRKGGSFTYNAGADGMTYVNKGCTTWGTQNNDADVDVAIGNQTATWEFAILDWTNAEGEVVTGNKYIQLAANTAFPYISSDAQYQNPLFRVEQLTNSKMVLFYETPDRSIAWRFVFTSAADQRLVEESGFDASSDFNLWKNATIEMGYYYAPGWAQIADPGMTKDGASYLFALPEATFDRWQCQVAFNTDVAVNAATNYDFSVVLNASKDVRAMVKLTQRDNDENFFFAEEVDLKAGEDCVFWKSDMPGIDAPQMKLVLDFGGNQAGTDVEVSNIVLKDHANDDGTVLPDQQGGGDEPETTMDWNTAAASNLWNAVEEGSAFIQYTTWFADNGWSTLPTQPAITHADGKWEFDVPEGTGGSQWQGQFAIETTLAVAKAKKYNFYLVLEADNDIPGATIKLTETNYSDDDKRDDNFFFADRHDITADHPFIYKVEAAELAKDDAHALSLVFDFGGAPAGTHIAISNIYFEEATLLSYDDEANLWKAVDDGSAFIQYTTWFADNGWSTLPTQPTISHNGNAWEFDIPEGMGGSQWQGQFAIETSLATAQNDPYNFSCTILADMDLTGVTIKLTETNYSDEDKRDNNFYFADRHDAKADEPFVYKMTGVTLPQGDAHALSLVFDFGGSPAGAHVKISDIIFEKAQ